MGKRICLLDLNYTLVSNQLDTRTIRPFSARLAAEEYRLDLLEKIKNDYVIIITARPAYQEKQTLDNILRKTGWQPHESYFNDIDADPPTFKRSALQRFIFPKHGNDGVTYYAVESNPRTRQMYSKYGIDADPYDRFINPAGVAERKSKTGQSNQTSLFDQKEGLK